jgi:hypothetical protein
MLNLMYHPLSYYVTHITHIYIQDKTSLDYAREGNHAEVIAVLENHTRSEQQHTATT